MSYEEKKELIKSIVLFICFIFFIIIDLYTKLYKHKISKTKNFEKSLELRKKAFIPLKRISLAIRICQSSFIYCIIIVIILELFDFRTIQFYVTAISITFLLYICIMFPFFKRWTKNDTKIKIDFGAGGSREFSFSFLTKCQYLENHTNFILFLRGFNDDVYNTGSIFDDLSYIFSRRRFDEEAFVEKLAHYASDIAAIGSPQEVNCPKGATRVYLDNNTWKVDVHELMEKSEEIYILLHDSPACIWEISNSASMLYKTTFIVEDKNTFHKISAQRNIDFLPESINLKKNEIAFISFRTGKANIVTLKHKNRNYKKYFKITYQSRLQSN